MLRTRGAYKGAGATVAPLEGHTTIHVIIVAWHVAVPWFLGGRLLCKTHVISFRQDGSVNLFFEGYRSLNYVPLP